MFRPDKDTLPRWVGNLKQYRLGRSAGRPRAGRPQWMRDGAGRPSKPAPASSAPAPAATGRRPSATPTGRCSSTTGIATNAGECSTPTRLEHARTDRRREGRPGQALRGSTVASRNLKTCTACGLHRDWRLHLWQCRHHQARLALGSMPSARPIDCARLNNRGSAAAGPWTTRTRPTAVSSSTEMRPSVHGDVVHSRPVAINFGSRRGDPARWSCSTAATTASCAPSTATVRTATVRRRINGVAASEIWGIRRAGVPPARQAAAGQHAEHRGSRARTQITVDRRPKPYGFDGPITAHAEGDDALDLRHDASRWTHASTRSTSPASPGTSTVRRSSGASAARTSRTTSGARSERRRRHRPDLVRAEGSQAKGYKDLDGRSSRW